MKSLSNIDLIKTCAENTENQKVWLEFFKRFDRYIKLCVLRAYRLLAVSNFRKDIILKEEIRDLVQEVYMKLFKNGRKLIKNFEPEYDDSIYAYLSLTCTSVVKDHFKKFSRLKRKEPTQFKDTKNVFALEAKSIDKMMSSFEVSNPEDQVIVKDLLEKIKHYYNTFHAKKNNERRKLIFQLYFLEGLSINDIACIKGLNISLNNVNTIIWRMKKEIRNYVYNGSFSYKAK